MTVGDTPVEYRFLFGGSKTKWQKISPAPRPSVGKFQWKIEYPEYTLLPNELRASDLGDLRVLKDSRLELSIEVDQHLQAVSLLVENADTGQQQRIDLQKSPIPIEEVGPSNAIEVWYCEVDSAFSSRFQVNLESKNQFLGEYIRNTFSPWYKLDILPDPPAVVDWIATPETASAEKPRSSQPWMTQPDDLARRHAEHQIVCAIDRECRLKGSATYASQRFFSHRPRFDNRGVFGARF